jgi:hypothetical protein
MRIRSAAVAAAVIAASFAAATSAAVRHVPGDYPTIQAAIDAAQPGDRVMVADGVYTGDGNRDISFLGKAITVRSANGAATTIIDAQGSLEDPHRGFVFADGETETSILDGFTVRNGHTLSGAVADQFNGGAVLCTNGSWPTIRNCVFENNWCGCWGGAIHGGWFSEGPIQIINCTMKGNYSNDDGGAVFTIGASLSLINCLIVGNEAATEGGGVCSFGAESMDIRNSTIVGNTSINGGGIYGFSNFATISNSIIRGNFGVTEIVGTDDITYSNVNGVSGLGNIDADPRFIDPDAGDYRLRFDSPCVDAGDPMTVSEAGETDLNGDLRILNGVIDMGADETRRLGDVDGDDTVNTADLLDLLAMWGVCGAGCAADFDHTGNVGTGDLLILLANWGQL